ncbi:microtubule-associated protein futsch-like isoform X2 [Teleopsis dalmanni]|uniref:microtubule-associated protein futsch-like isoform X2 n=1 Tax=Teleopsis dalmanni TaxID=139649 RepID=UPI0018CDE806|nr:microtubule-associated protein futsch-like isoform X2 [Teleopsis dalmanni]
MKPKPQDSKDDILSKLLTEPKPTDKIDQKPSAIVIPKPLDITKPVTKDVFDDESSDDEFGLHKEKIPEMKPKPQDTKDDVLPKTLTEPKPTDKIDQKPSDIVIPKPLDVTKPVTKDVFDDESSDDEFGLHKEKIPELKPKPQDTKDDVLSKPLTEPKLTDKIDQKPSAIVIPKPLDVTKPVTKDVFDDEFGLHKDKIPEMKPKPQDSKDDILSKPLTEVKPTDKIDHKPSDIVIPKSLDVTKSLVKNIVDIESLKVKSSGVELRVVSEPSSDLDTQTLSGKDSSFSNIQKTPGVLSYFVKFDQAKVVKNGRTEADVKKVLAEKQLQRKKLVKKKNQEKSSKVYSRSALVAKRSERDNKTSTSTSSSISDKRIRRNMDYSITKLENNKHHLESRVKTVIKTERRSEQKTSIQSDAISNRYRFRNDSSERLLSPLPNQIVNYRDDDYRSRSTTPRPRTRTDVTQVPINPTLRSFSPTPNRPKPDYSKVTSVYAQTRTSQKVTAERRVEKVSTIKTKREKRVTDSPIDDAQRKRLITPTPTTMHRYMQHTLSSSMHVGSISKIIKDEASTTPPMQRSPIPTQYLQKSSASLKKVKSAKDEHFILNEKNKLNKNKMTNLRKSTSDSKESLKGRISNLKRGSESDSKESLKSIDKIYPKSKKIENKQTVAYMKDTSRERKVIQQNTNNKNAYKKEKIVRDLKMSGVRTFRSTSHESSIITDNKMASSEQKQVQRSKVPISTSSTTKPKTKVNKIDENKKTVIKPQLDNKKKLKHSTSEVEKSKEKIKSTYAADAKVQKKTKNSINESYIKDSSSTSRSSSLTSTQKTTVRSAISKKSDKEILNVKLAEKKSSTTTTTTATSATTAGRISTIRARKEPVASTAIVSTIIIDDDSDVNRSVKSNDSTKSSTSSSGGSRKVITSEVFTKTFGPDKPFEVIYRQPDTDTNMTVIRPPSSEQRCISEFDVSFIDTTDSSLSDSVALPMFNTDQDRLLAASPGSPKPTRSPFALIEETIRRQQTTGLALDPSSTLQLEAGSYVIEAETALQHTEVKIQKSKTEVNKEIQKVTHDLKHLPEDLKITISPTKEASGEIDHSTDTTPVPFSAVVPKNDLPKPKPRSVVATSPISEFDDNLLTSTQEQITTEPLLTSTVDVTSESSVSAPVPVPKPRSQLKQTDSYKNLASLAEQSDSISLRSLEFTEDISKTDEPSTDISIRSQRDMHTTETESFEPTSESVDDVDTEKSDQADGKTTSFYIGESSRNVIVKTTPTKSTSEFITDANDAMQATIEAKDISLMKEVSVDSDENNDVFKEYVTMKRDQEEYGSKLIRQSSDTRNDLLEQESAESKQSKDALEKSVESTKLTSTVSTDDSIKEISEISRTDSQEYTVSTIITESLDTVLTDKGYTSVEKSELETLEKEIPLFQSKCKVIHSPQDLQVSAEEPMYKSTVEISSAEAQLSLDSASDSLKDISKDIEMATEIKTVLASKEKEPSTSASIDTAKLSYASMQEEEDISSFIGIPDKVQEGIEKPFDTLQQTEGLFEGTVRETLNREAVMAHYGKDVFNNLKPETLDDHGSLGFVSTGTGEDYSSSEEHAAKEEHASLGFISTETAEDFSSMEDYYQEKMVKANILTEEATTQKSSSSSTFEEITSDQTMKPFDVVIHRVKTESSTDTTNRWSVPEIDQSSSSESYYKSFEKSESRPLSSDIENLLTQPNSSDYQTAADASSTFRETTEYVSAVSSFSSSGKTISSHESMRSLDSQSETSAYLGSIDVSELSETLVASSTEADALEAEEIARLRDLQADDEDSTESLDMDAAGYPIGAKQSLMKRSQEMIFKPKAEEITKQEVQVETVKVEEFPKPKEVEKTWGLAYPMEEVKSDDLKDMERTEDILLYHSDSRHSIDEAKLASSLDDGSILSVSMSSTSNIETVVENFEDMVGSVGSSSLTGVDGFQFSHDDPVSSYPDEPFIMEMESKDQSPQDSTATTPPGEARKRGHKRSESTSITGETLKNLTDNELQIVGENKESESESDTDPYESEYARQFRSPNDRKAKKKKQAAAEMDHSFEAEKRPFTPSQLVAEVIVEDAATEELEAEQAMIEERRPSQNMQDYSNIPDITVTEHTQKSPILEEETDKFEEKTLYKMKTQEELNKAADVPLYQKSRTELEEENFQKLVQEQYKQKLAELQRAQDSDYDENKAPDSPDSFEMVDQPDISDEFVIIEEVAKEANEVDLGGKSIKIKSTKYESKHDEDVEKIIIKSAPADPKLGSQIYRDDLNFEFEESPPTAGSSSDQQDESDSGESAAANKRWVEMQLTDAQLRYPYDITGGVLEDIKEEDGEFEVGSSRISSFKDSFSSTPEYDVLAARRYFSRGEHDDISMSSLQEFESLEQAISLENRNKTHQGSTDSSNGSFTRRYIVRHSGSGNAQGDDISISSLKEFEGLENACIEAHLIEIKAKEEAALLSRSDESNKSNGSDRGNGVSNVVVTKVTRTVTHTEAAPGQQNIEALLKEKLNKCERKDNVVITEISTEPLDLKSTKIDPLDSEKGSVDSLEINKSLDVMTSSLDSFDISKDATTRSDVDSLETDKKPPTREESIESIENEQMDVMSKIVSSDGLTTTTKTTTTSTDADGVEHTVTHITTITTLTGDGGSMDGSIEQMPKDASIDSLCIEQTTSSAGTTATYQTSAGNSQMSGSVTSCASSTLMEDSYPAAMSTSTMSGSHWMYEDNERKQMDDEDKKQQTQH